MLTGSYQSEFCHWLPWHTFRPVARKYMVNPCHIDMIMHTCYYFFGTFAYKMRRLCRLVSVLSVYTAFSQTWHREKQGYRQVSGKPTSSPLGKESWLVSVKNEAWRTGNNAVPGSFYKGRNTKLTSYLGLNMVLLPDIILHLVKFSGND